MWIAIVIIFVVMACNPAPNHAAPFIVREPSTLEELQLQNRTQRQDHHKTKMLRKHVDMASSQIGKPPSMKPDSHDGMHSSTSARRAHSNSGIPGLFDVLRAIPMRGQHIPEALRNSTQLFRRSGRRRVMSISMEQHATKASPTERSIAVCMTGHLRTFSMLGVHSSYAHHLLRSTPGVKEAHLYLYGHLGRYDHDGWGWPSGVSSTTPLNETDLALQKALAYPGLNLKYVEIHKTGSCEEYMQLDGAIACASTNSDHMQFVWLDRCIRKVFSTGIEYDLVVRTRPDVGICKPMPWRSVSATHVSYIYRVYGDSGEDWFFTIPSSIIALHWNIIIDRLIYKNDAGFFLNARAEDRLPDSIIERANDHFAVTVVRSPFENFGQIQCKLWHGFQNWNISEAGHEDNDLKEMIRNVRKEKTELENEILQIKMRKRIKENAKLQAEIAQINGIYIQGPGVHQVASSSSSVRHDLA